MAIRVEPVCFLEEVFATHGRTVIHQDGERVGRVSLAVRCRDGLVGAAVSETDTCGWPETKRFFDNGESVGKVLNEVGILLEEVGGCRGVFAKEVVVLGTDALEDFGVLAYGCIGVLEFIVSPCSCLCMGCGGLTESVLAEVSCPAKMSVLTDVMSISRASLSNGVARSVNPFFWRLIAIASSMAK